MMYNQYEFYKKLLVVNHLLIAGATGSGKSVVENGMIYHLLLQDSKKNKFILIDPKRVELFQYKEIKYYSLGYASEIKDIKSLLNNIIHTMENHYIIMQKQGLKMYDGYQIYVFIDEYADIVIQDKTAVPLIQRIAQLGRASGIHLILATQRTTRDIISGSIKVNLDYRLALRVPTRQDSRNIIEQAGADTLPPFGYGILRSPMETELYKIPLVTDAEIKQIIKFRKDERNEIRNY